MYGLIVLFIFGLYITACVGAVGLAYWFSQKYQWKQPWMWGLLMFVLYNTPVGLYIIPPAIAMNSYCDQSGFWLYKTPEQWKLENPGVAETLTVIGKSEPDRKTGERKMERVFHLNERFDWVIEASGTNTANVNREVQTVVDRLTNEIMAKRIDFKAVAYPLYAPSTCFKEEERKARWLVGSSGFMGTKNMFKNLGEK